MSRYEILKVFHKWEQENNMKGAYTSMVVQVVNRHPRYLDKMVAMDIHDEKELWEVVLEGV